MRVLYDSVMVEDGVEKVITKLIETGNITFMHDSEEIQIGARYYIYPSAPTDDGYNTPEPWPPFIDFVTECLMSGVVDLRGFEMREKENKPRYNNDYKSSRGFNRNYHSNRRGGYNNRR